MVERPQINLMNSAIAFVAAVGLNLVLIPAYGALGAAFGVLCPYAIKGLLRWAEIRFFFAWRWPWHALFKPWIAALVPLPFALLVRWMVPGVWSSLFAAALYLAGYFLTWRLIGLEPNDRAVLDQLFKKKAKR